MDKERKFTQDECVKNGGHVWKYWRANTQVDENFNPTGIQYAAYYQNGEPTYRGCPMCGRVEVSTAEWKEVK